jgi:hypothetical protein
MSPGDISLGPDGTVYVVTRARDVRVDQPRWWIGPGWKHDSRAEDLPTPETIRDLGLERRPRDVRLALVLP